MAFREFLQIVFHRLRATSRRGRWMRNLGLVLFFFVVVPLGIGALATQVGKSYRDEKLLKSSDSKQYSRDLPQLNRQLQDGGRGQTGDVSIVVDRLPATIDQALRAPAAAITPVHQQYASNASGGDPGTPKNQLAPPQQLPDRATVNQLFVASKTFLACYDTYGADQRDYLARMRPLVTGSLSGSVLNHDDDILPSSTAPGASVSSRFLPEQLTRDDELTGLRVLLYRPGANAQAYVTISGYVWRSSNADTKYDNTFWLRGYGLVMQKTAAGWRVLRIAAEDRAQTTVDGLPVPVDRSAFQRSTNVGGQTTGGSAGQSK